MVPLWLGSVTAQATLQGHVPVGLWHFFPPTYQSIGLFVVLAELQIIISDNLTTRNARFKNRHSL